MNNAAVLAGVQWRMTGSSANQASRQSGWEHAYMCVPHPALVARRREGSVRVPVRRSQRTMTRTRVFVHAFEQNCSKVWSLNSQCPNEKCSRARLLSDFSFSTTLRNGMRTLQYRRSELRVVGRTKPANSWWKTLNKSMLMTPVYIMLSQHV
jgi:hypothetical protein